MFRKKQNKSIEINKLSSLVADNVEINGDIAFSAGLRVDGRVSGNLSNKEGSKGLLVLSDQGRIEGDVHVYDAVVNGTIVGNLTVDHFLELQPKSRVTGNISYRQLQMDCGASVDGTLTRIGDELAERNVVELQPAVAKQS
ncbi:bactofilin family protein [Cognatazoarcus halotolerans]|uniref:bactofilin family protein n=1 Tax=Cognatazoarcus halotolerans TaxID=2686016 RepID=UPI00135B81F3|nr:polymer-forming cytoskeletal protein [Cognatazoarcus halotolerans]MBX3679316.1 polymer-forming cytoskeletal protein [Rhodocyclaceae bacterium]MCB1898401.1 polymer-forming cytoskeletal protein [Rhodocyclaceae bacterium]MCP5311479.1 polymer-forming cytoskeletal protein [Zoogloeaceae bacterium]